MRERTVSHLVDRSERQWYPGHLFANSEFSAHFDLFSMIKELDYREAG